MITICFITLSLYSSGNPVHINAVNIDYVETNIYGNEVRGTYVETGGHSSNGGRLVRETPEEVIAQIEEKCL